MNENRKALFELLGGFYCQKCGVDDFRVLQIDHIFGNGQEMPLGKPGIIHYYLENADIANEELQVLCCNCHRIKTLETSPLGRGKGSFKDKEFDE